MGFTLAHPAAVLNIVNKNRKYFNNAALILGTMAPDFEYFIFFKPKSIIGHKLIGCLILNLPLVFLAYFIFYKFIKNTFIEHLPKKINRKLGCVYKDTIKLKSIKDYVVFIFSAFLGMITHMIWDGFTHNSGFFVKNLYFLNNKFLGIYIYKFLQHGSTLIGIIAIILYIKSLKDIQINKVNIDSKIKYWSYIATLSIFILVSIVFSIKNLRIGALVVSSMNSFFLAMLIVSILFSYSGIFGN